MGGGAEGGRGDRRMLAGASDRDRVVALDGLRAIAVLLVLLFHGGISWAPGGFLGVDVFLALSGFLITGVLLDRSRTHRVVPGSFWAGRARRIVPALLVLVAAVVAWNASTADEPRLAGDVVSTLGFVANLRHMTAADGYVSHTADPSPLLHTWSLAVEVQLYVLWPLVLAVFVRARRRAELVWGTILWAVALTGASLAAGWVLVGTGPLSDELYLSTVTRAVPFFLGAILAGLIRLPGSMQLRRDGSLRTGVQLGALIGVAFMALLVATLDVEDPAVLRGGTLIVGVASVFVLASVAWLRDGLLATALSFPPLVWLGTISYGVYLWHWPLQLALSGDRTHLHGAPLFALRFVLTVAAAALSYVVIERPIRTTLLHLRPLPVGLAVASVFIAAVGVVALRVPDETDRLDVADRQELAVATSIATTTTVAATTTVAPTTTVPVSVPPVRAPVAPAAIQPTAPSGPTLRVAFLGDSVARSLARGLSGIDAPYGLEVLDDAILGCGVARSGPYRLSGSENGLAGECIGWSDTWSARVARDHPDVAVVLVGRHEVLDRQLNGAWTNILDPAYADYVRSELMTAVQIAGSSGARVVLLTAPNYRRPERPDGTQWQENDPARVAAFNVVLRGVGAATGARIVDLGDRLCPGGQYRANADGVSLRGDGVHVSAGGAQWLAPWLLPQLRA